MEMEINYFEANLRYQEIEDFVVLGAEIVLLVFLVFYTIEELIEIATLGKQYFKGFFNNTDYTVLILGYSILGHRLVFRFFKKNSKALTF